MEQSNKKQSDSTGAEDQEIDRIMKEIDDLEQKVDSPTEAATTESSEAKAPDNVVQLRAAPTPATEVESTESDLAPVPDEPFMKGDSETGEAGNLSMKIGGCTTVSLEFERAGVVVSFECTETGLVITTDQGAEFRVPFGSYRKAA